MRIALALIAAAALAACSDDPTMVSADAAPAAATAAVGELVRDGDPYAPPAIPGATRAAQAPPSSL